MVSLPVWVPYAIAAALLVIVSWAIVGSEDAASGLAARAAANINATGLENPVTAVLLDFRAYDTFLELLVMFVAVVATWSIGRMLPTPMPGTPVLNLAVKLVGPIAMLVSGYLLWIGATAPGGAFQAGAVLAGAGVLALSAGFMPPHIDRSPVLYRLLLVLGVGAFAGVGAVVALSGAGTGIRAFLDYPDATAKWFILGIEAAAMIAIAVTLLALFKGGHPHTEQI